MAMQIPIPLTYYFRVVCAKDGRGGMTTPMTDYACDQRGERGKRETHGGDVERACMHQRAPLIYLSLVTRVHRPSANAVPVPVCT
jgi:hypothetical protein